MLPTDQSFLRRQESSLFVILSATKNLFFINHPPKPDSHPQSLSFRAQPLSFRAQPRNLLNHPPRTTPPISASPFKIRCSLFDIRVSRRPAPLVRPVQLVQPVRFVRPLSISPRTPPSPLVSPQLYVAGFLFSSSPAGDHSPAPISRRRVGFSPPLGQSHNLSFCSWKSCHFTIPLLLCEVATSRRSTSFPGMVSLYLQI